MKTLSLKVSHCTHNRLLRPVPPASTTNSLALLEVPCLIILCKGLCLFVMFCFVLLFLLTGPLSIYNDFWFCIFMIFLYVRICVSRHLSMVLVLFLWFSIFFCYIPLCFFLCLFALISYLFIHLFVYLFI